jgi:protein-arginine kinase activator protein McsA
MICQSCSKQKNDLKPAKSDIIKGMTLFMCETCIENKFEPRYIIILGGRQNGAESVRDYVIKHRYVGRTIFAEELIA